VQRKTSIDATCPECRGPLSVVRTDELVEVRCLVGHTYSPRTLLQAHGEAQEKALWSAAVALRETEAIVNSVSAELPTALVERLRVQVEKKQRQAEAVQAIIEDLEAFAT
jgi:two-component system chemotaxis response regulator CheB